MATIERRQSKITKGLNKTERMKASQITKLDLFTEVKDGKFEVNIPFTKGQDVFYLETGYKTKPAIKSGKIIALTEVTLEINRDWVWADSKDEKDTFTEKIDQSVEFLIKKDFPTPEEITKDDLYTELDMNKIFATKEALLASL